MFTGWKKDPKVIARAEEIKKELEFHDTEQKNIITSLIAKNESLLTANAERDREIANLKEKLQLEVEKREGCAETGEKSVVISDLEVQFEKLDSLKISLETMLEEAKIENQNLVDQLAVLPGLANEVDEMMQRNVFLEEKSEKERNLLEHAEKELEGLKNEGSDQNEYSALNAAVFPFIMCAILWIIWVVVVVFLG